MQQYLTLNKDLFKKKVHEINLKHYTSDIQQQDKNTQKSKTKYSSVSWYIIAAQSNVCLLLVVLESLNPEETKIKLNMMQN